MNRYLIAGTVLATIVGVGATWQLKHERSPVRVTARFVPNVKVTSIGASGSLRDEQSAERHGAQTAQARNLESQPRLEAKAPGTEAVGVAPPTVKSNQYLNELERVAKITTVEREQLSVILHDAADMQKRIDKKPDPERREQLQYKLVQQMIMRLRLVLGEERAKSAAAELGPGNPRIEFDERTPT